MPLPTQEPPARHGPTQLGARQSELLQRLRQARAGAHAPTKKRQGVGVYASEVVTDFDEAMDEAYDRLLGRRKRQHEQKNGQSQQHHADGNSDDEAETLPAAQFLQRLMRG